MQQLNSSNISLTANISTEGYISEISLITSSVLGVCFILGVPGNIAVMVRLAGWLKTDSFTPRLMLSLAVSDLLTLIFLPFRIFNYLHGWVFGLVLCKLLYYMVYVSSYCSVMCVMLMSMQRYLQVLHREKWNKLGSKGKMIILIGMWILSAVLSCYDLIQYSLILDNRQCVYYMSKDEQLTSTIWEVVMFVVSFTIVAFCYFRLYWKVNNSTFFNSNSLIKIVTRIVICFFIFWIPYQICNLVMIIAELRGDYRLSSSTGSALTITSAVVFMNSCVNPFLYAFSAPALQQQTAGPDDA